MKKSIFELRYKMNHVLRALDRREEVTIIYRGKVKGTITPADPTTDATARKHPFFGSLSAQQPSIAEEMEKLRAGRFSAN